MLDKSENCTFFELVKNYRVNIPIIQRDYAQGRVRNQEICSNFLNAIKVSIENKCAINLDFVYGNIQGDVFQPLDGQQRLTTLFLLHWYAFVKEKEEDKEIQNILKNFSYETRLSSRRFCEALILNHIYISVESESLSDIIQDSEWFFMSWNQDSTIKAMLNTINIIHQLFREVSNLWKALTEDNIISFHLLILENFGLSDDLYIKMNARGKLLTPFENLKAEVQDKIQRNNWENHVPETDRFYHKIDTIWTDFLWKDYRKNNSVDEAHMNFISTLVMFQLSIGNLKKGNERIDVIRKLNENASDRNLIHYIDEDTYKYICEVYDLYAGLQNERDIPELKFPMWRHEPEISLLNQILNGETKSYTHKVLFFAQTEFLLNNHIMDEERFIDWMRVIRNIISRGDITVEGKRPDIVRSPETFHGMINLIHELANGCGDIYNYLNNNSVTSSFAKEQVKEESLKAHIIVENPLYKELIFNTEDNELLRGKITFVLKCAGYKGTINTIDYEKLRKVQRVFEKYFNNELDPMSEEFDLLRRAMLTIEVKGKYEYYDYWWSYWYAGEAEKRKLFPLYREIEFFINNEDSNEYFRKLVDALITKDYNDIITDFEKPNNMGNWQYRLIKESDLLRNCISKYIAIAEDNSYCFLLKSKRPPNVEGSLKVI